MRHGGLLVVGVVGVMLLGAVAAVGCGGSGALDQSALATGSVETTAVPSPTIDKSKFATVWADFKAIDSATTVGVNYAQFGLLLQTMVTDLSLLPSDLSTKEQAMAGGLAAIAQAYIDSYNLWEIANHHSTWPTLYVSGPSGGRGPGEEAEPMITTYGITTTTEVLAKGTNVFIADDAFLEIWAWASAMGAELAPLLAP